MTDWCVSVGFAIVFLMNGICSLYTCAVCGGIVRPVFFLGMGILSVAISILLVKEVLPNNKGSVS